MPYVTSPHGPRIHYRVVGTQGPFVMLIQGLGLSGDFWFDLPERLAQDAGRPFRVIVPDNRGTGRSDRGTGPFTMAQMADDLVAILTAEGIDQAYICGISLGGMIAQHIALNHGSQVKGLVLMATTPGLPHGRPPPIRSLATLLTLPFVLKPGSKPRQLVRLMIPASVEHQAEELFAGWTEAITKNRVSAERKMSERTICALSGSSTAQRETLGTRFFVCLG